MTDLLKRPVDHILDAIAEYEKIHGRKPFLIRLSTPMWELVRDDAEALGLLSRNHYAATDSLAGVKVERDDRWSGWAWTL